MPVLDGIEATRQILADPRCAHVKVIVLTTFAIDEYVFGALRSGAVGFLLKDTRPAELIRAVQVAASGDALLSPSITKRLIEEFASTPAAATDGDTPGPDWSRERHPRPRRTRPVQRGDRRDTSISVSPP